MTGEKIKNLRDERKMSRTELAEACGVDVKAFGFYERGKVLPPTKTLVKICEVLNVSADYLLDLTDQPARPETDPDLYPEQLDDAAQILKTIYSIAKIDKGSPHTRNCLPVIRDIVSELQELQLTAGIKYDEIREKHPAFALDDLNDSEERRKIRVKAQMQDPEAIDFTEGDELYRTEIRAAANKTAISIADRVIIDFTDQLLHDIG